MYAIDVFKIKSPTWSVIQATSPQSTPAPAAVAAAEGEPFKPFTLQQPTALQCIPHELPSCGSKRLSVKMAHTLLWKSLLTRREIPRNDCISHTFINL